MTEPLLLTGRNAPNVKTLTVTVPAGHVLPNGNVVKFPFDVIVQAGARWHPEWDAPRYSVMAYRVMAMGDAIGFTGTSAMAFPLPKWVAHLTQWHGKEAPPGSALNYLEEPTIYAPYKPERIADFILPQQMKRLN